MPEYDTSVRKEGYFVGYYGSVEIDYFISDVQKKLGDNLKKLKNMSVKYYYSDVVSEEKIVDVIESIRRLVDEDVSIVVNGKVDDSLTPGIVEYEILLFGLVSFL